MENSLVTYGFNKDRERIEHLMWICDQLCTVFSKNIIGNVTAKNYLKESLSCIFPLFKEHANRHHATIKFTAEISDKETTLLDTCVYKGERFKKENILDVRSHFKPTETFQLRTIPPATHQGSVKDLSKAKL